MNMNRENEIMNVRVDEIIPNRFQPRLAFNQTELKELSESIKVHGIIQPLVLRRIGDKFEIIAGERRYKAAIMAGLLTVPAIIMNIDDKQSAEVAVVENLQRKDLTAIEEAKSYKKILDMGYTQEELASRMGVTQPTVANKLRLLNLSEVVQQALLKNQISERHARSLLQIPDQSLQVNMLNRIISEKLTVRQTDEEISKILGKPVSTIPPTQSSTERPINQGVPQAQPIPGVVPSTSSPIPSINQAPVTNPTNMEVPKPVSVPPISPVEPPKFTNPIPSNEPVKAFDVDVNKIKNESEDIIKEHKPSDIDMLMRKQSSTDEENTGNSNKKISLEDVAANVDMGELVKPEKMAINPFQEIDPEVMDFSVPSSPAPSMAPTPNPAPNPSPMMPPTQFETPNISSPTTPQKNSLIEEFRQSRPTSYQPMEPPMNTTSTGGKSLSGAINIVRSEARKIEELGFQIDTEEFDFEDMYQIIIKIKKD